MDNKEATEMLRRKWPGAEEALTDLIKEMEATFRDDWQAAKVLHEGPRPFQERMVNSLRRSLAALDHEVLADLSAHAMVPIIFRLIVQVAEARKKKKGEGHANDR